GTVALAVTGATSVSIGSLAASVCADATFVVSVPRAAASYNKARPYHIEASGTGVTTGQTPAGRQLYVEKLVSQNRNSTLKIAGPGGCNASLSTCDPAMATPVLGSTYTYKLYGSTATSYEQLEGYLTFPTNLFRIVSAHSDYSVGASRDTVYVDACGWQPNPAAAGYMSCLGTGKAGGDVVITYTVRAIATGSGTLNAMLYDYSGSSYHYNSDYGIAVNFGVTVVDPTPTPTPTVEPTPTPTVEPTPTPSPSASPASSPTLVVDLEVVIPGATIEVCGEGWLPGSEVEISLDGDVVLGTVTVDEDGTFCVDLVIPAGTVQGEYSLVATGLDTDGAPASQVDGIQVALPATDTAAPGAGSTDSPGRSPLLLLSLAFLAGAVLSLLRRPARR
ncbi:MAG: hypothetical protein MUQ32_09330, partial [Chloroflexi bacterium]|nr:hypothetical protein [Chloroflexota bacterium]